MPSGDGLPRKAQSAALSQINLVLGFCKALFAIPVEESRILLAHFDNLFSAACDGHQLGIQCLVISDSNHLMLARLKSNLLRTSTRNDECISIDRNCDVGVVDLNDQSAVAANNYESSST